MTAAAPVLALAAALFLQPVRTMHTRGEFERTGVELKRDAQLRLGDGVLLEGSAGGIVLRKADGRAEPFPPNRTLPWNEITVIAARPESACWIGTRRGLIRYDEADTRSPVRYFAGKRWLLDDHVTGIGFEAGGAIWVETPSGFSRRQALTVLSPDERPVMKWNGNPYIPDGGDGGRSEDDGAFFLLPYWMGRYHRLIQP